MYNVYQHWDKLKVCVVGKSYPPEFYSFIQNKKLRNLFEKIAFETNEDFDNLEKLIQSFGVKTIRPNTPNINAVEFVMKGERIPPPISMIPRDQMIMIGDKFFLFPYDHISRKSSIDYYMDKDTNANLAEKTRNFANWWEPIINDISAAGNTIIKDTHDSLLKLLHCNGIVRCGKDLYFGVNGDDDKLLTLGLKKLQQKYFQNYRSHQVKSYGHVDGVFKPVVPGLIMSIKDTEEIPYHEEFPDWEVVYLPNESLDKVMGWYNLKEKNRGSWWIKGHENDDELIEFVEIWLKDWIGYVEETVFDVNMLMIDQKNAIVCGYNKVAFDAFERYGVTPHLINLRHRYFWDGGVHCSTADLNRESTLQDYFPERKDNEHLQYLG
jgi:glycine amidinotransferase